MTRILPRTLAILLLAGVLAACNSTRWVPQGERLLVRNVLRVPPGTLDPEGLTAIIKQKPNKRVLGLPFYLHLYNLRDPLRVERRRRERDSLCMLENTTRRAAGEKLHACDRSLRGRNGEPPVVLDTLLTRRGVEQLELYAFKEGYFEARISDTVRHSRPRRFPFKGWSRRSFRKPKAVVEYVVDPGRPWSICQVDLRVDDPTMAMHLRQDMGNSLLRPGERFDGDVLEAERTRITAYLRSLGYLYFSRDMVLFDADTAAGDHQVDLLISLERPAAATQRGLKGTPEGRVFYVENVVLDIRRRAGQGPLADTVHRAGFDLVYEGTKPPFQIRALSNQVLIRPDARFNQNDADRTFRRLTNLRVFDRIDLTYDTTGLRRGQVNCHIGLLPSKRQGVSVEVFGTNRGGFLGTSLNLNYRHRNMFRSMAALQATLTVGGEAQQLLSTAVTSSEDASTVVGRDALFNTLEIGPEVSLRFPVNVGSAKSGGARFVLSSLFNYQRRPDYTRTLAKTSAGIEVNSNFDEVWGWSPFEVNLVRIPRRSSAFEQFLANANDVVLANSYTDHLITGMRWFYTRNTQLMPGRQHRRDWFFRGVLEWMGYGGFMGTRRQDPETGQVYRSLGDIRYAEYVKLDLDGRHYLKLHDRSTLAFRLAVGAAKPFGNLTVMPFETSFFTGGANSIRAWRARSLGPGSYYSPLNNFDRIGEARLEANVELRFKMFGYLEGALFTDLGNIWYLQDNPAREGSRLAADRFLGEIAIGTGVGARLNFDFFIVRFDLGLQTKDPSLPAGQRWIFEPHDEAYRTRFGQKLNLNLGIGYPF
jgi:hypothetical protein